MAGWGADVVMSEDEQTAWVVRPDGTAIAALRIERFGQVYVVDGYEACGSG